MPEYEKCQCELKDDCIFLKGNQTEFELRKDDCEIRADVSVKEMRCVRVWGEVINCKGVPVENALVKLVKVTCKAGKTKLEGVAHTVTDCKGVYQFEICPKEYDDCEERREKITYRVIVSMAAAGKERIICHNDCKSCCDMDKED